MILETMYDVIEVLGGPATVAGVTGFTERHVLIWRNRGWFPTVTYRQIRVNLLARGHDAMLSLFVAPGRLMDDSQNLEKKFFRASQSLQSVAF